MNKTKKLKYGENILEVDEDKSRKQRKKIKSDRGVLNLQAWSLTLFMDSISQDKYSGWECNQPHHTASFSQP